MSASDSAARRIAGIAALDQPLRRDLYRLLCRRAGWTSRDEASDALGVGRPITAFHLDKLVEAGLLETRYERRTGRSGPGAGRPAKLYRAVEDEIGASVPDRRYDLAGSLLAAAVAAASQTGEAVGECLHRCAHDAGVMVGESAKARSPGRRGDRRAAIKAVLRDHGYDPVPAARGEVALANCPFHRLAEEHPSLVCGMNLDFLTGVVAGLDAGEPALRTRLAPQPGYCCVRISRR